MTTTDDFVDSLQYLNSMGHGYAAVEGASTKTYEAGFFVAIADGLKGGYLVWDSGEGYDTSGAFRRVLDSYREYQDDWDEETGEAFLEGYEEALLIFREAKGL